MSSSTKHREKKVWASTKIENRLAFLLSDTDKFNPSYFVWNLNKLYKDKK